MTASISRKLYQQLLSLYPQPFRHEFGDEMLGIFEDCKRAQGSWRLLADVIFSAFKQQMRYLSTPVPRSEPIYLEIASSPKLARMLAVAAFSASLTAGVFLGGKPEAAESWMADRPEVLFWFSTVVGAQSCSDSPEKSGKPKSSLLRVLVRRKFEPPEAWRVVRQYCSDTSERTEIPEGVLTVAHLGVRSP